MMNTTSKLLASKSLRTLSCFSISVLFSGIVYFCYNNAYVEYDPAVLMCNGEFCNLPELRDNEKFISSFISQLKEYNKDWKIKNNLLYIKRKLNNDRDLMMNYTHKELKNIDIDIHEDEDLASPNKIDWNRSD